MSPVITASDARCASVEFSYIFRSMPSTQNTPMVLVSSTNYCNLETKRSANCTFYVSFSESENTHLFETGIGTEMINERVNDAIL